MKCPKHNIDLKETNIVEYPNNRVKVVGKNYFCPESNCDYEKDDYEKS
ncbi:MAG: hypothetical protein AABY22_15580 [Nanoarchaeota archaeon]